MKVYFTLLALFVYSTNGEQCDSARANFQANNSACLSAFESTGINTALGLSVDSGDIELVCNNVDCQAAISSYVGSCSLNESVTASQASIMLGCIPVPSGGTCFDKITAYGGILDFFADFGSTAAICAEEFISFGLCSESCTQAFMVFTDQLGCCYNEAVAVSIASTNTTEAEMDSNLGFYTRDYFSFCNLTEPMFCQNRTAPAPSMCTIAIRELYGSNDACANAFRQFFTNTTNTAALSLTFSIPGCQDRFNNAVFYCNFDPVSNGSDSSNGSSTTRIGFNDTVIGDPVYEVPLNTISNETFVNITSLCYEIHGEAGKIFNLVSDGCVQVNAEYSAMDIPENGNIISRIGVLAYNTASSCINIEVNVNDCTPIINGLPYNSTLHNMDGVNVRQRGNRTRIAVPNCNDDRDFDDLVFWVVCQDINGQKMIKFQVFRGSGLIPDSHGLIGQFWNIPVFAFPVGTAPDGIDVPFIVTVAHPLASPRLFVADLYHYTWDHTLEPCLYAGSSQGGSIPIAIKSLPNDPVVEGSYFEYEVTDGIFGSGFKYNRFQDDNCL